MVNLLQQSHCGTKQKNLMLKGDNALNSELKTLMWILLLAGGSDLRSPSLKKISHSFTVRFYSRKEELSSLAHKLVPDFPFVVPTALTKFLSS